LGDKTIAKLKYASRMVAKVDSSLIQDGYSIYHHTFIFDEEGNWIVIQQGINEEKGNARRYQWPPKSEFLIDDPQNTISCDTRLAKVLNMTSPKSRGNRRASLDLSKENPKRLKRMFIEPVSVNQSTLESWMCKNCSREPLVMPSRINWKAMRKAYEFQPTSYEELVSLRGVGPSTIRGLSLIAELVYGELASWKDPVRFSFAFGGKDGVPFPVDRLAMDDSVDLLKTAIHSSPLKKQKRLRAIQRLRTCVPPILEEKFRALGP
jgi:hypothetical protein